MNRTHNMELTHRLGTSYFNRITVDLQTHDPETKCWFVNRCFGAFCYAAFPAMFDVTRVLKTPKHWGKKGLAINSSQHQRK